MNVTLVAVAKDEGAYISEWIYHHLRFGFNNIEVYTNNITDNTNRILSEISKKHPVKKICADFVFSSISNEYQSMIYGIAFEKAKLTGDDYVMFLDIDEFWTPSDLSTSIQEYLAIHNTPDIMSFPWAMKIDLEEFSPPFESKTHFRLTPRVKTILKTSVEITKMYPHGVISPSSKSILPCGKLHARQGEYKLDMSFVYSDLPSAFINHRYCRSEMEYISMLGRGRIGEQNIKNKAETDRFNSNRVGFMSATGHESTLTISNTILELYFKGYDDYLNSMEISQKILNAKQFVRNRYHRVIAQLNDIKDSELTLYKAALYNISLPEAKSHYESVVARIKERKQSKPLETTKS